MFYICRKLEVFLAILNFTAWISDAVKFRYNVGLESQTDHSTRPSMNNVVQPYENMNRLTLETTVVCTIPVL